MSQAQQCQKCETATVVTAYVHQNQRSSVTHHKAQAWVPIGLICKECHEFQYLPSARLKP